ncbi:MAG: ABC transporter substrate-binding protein [Actinomycetota bacterium]|nr:ABC transporter substrate-binding protein [Actinomycetota bacterium]
MVEGTFPQSLDPSIDFTTQGGEVHWLTHLGPYSFAHASGAAGTQVIPAVATALPKVAGGGKTYTFTIRSGLKYSDGTALKASDLTFGIERALKLGWSAASFLSTTIVGAADYAKGKAKSVSGITTNDATGQITIHLVRPYGAFEDVLAVPGVSFMPSTTPMKPEPSNPPVGFGPYVIKNVVANVGFDLAINPNYASQAIPGIPTGHVNVHVKVETNTTTEASAVLNNSADVFDWGDTIPPALIQQVQSQASNRFKSVQSNKTFYWFLNVTEKPFNNQLAREAVAMATDRPALAKLGSGALAPGCYLLPPAMVGYPTQPCPYGDPTAAPNLAAAKKLVQQSGMAGQPVTVWAENRQPRLEWAQNYTATLNAIGFKATMKTIADAVYFSTIETLKNHPQTGFADWLQDFPNPTDFYQNSVDGNSIAPVGNPNYAEVNDSHIQSELASLYAVPGSQLASAASRWAALDYYVAKKAYVVPFGYLASPEFVSSRIDFGKLIFSPLEGSDFSSLQLK